MSSRHLSLIQEESASREHRWGHSSGFQQTGDMGETVVSEEVDSAPPPVKEQQTGRLVEELTHLEAELRESLVLEAELQQEADVLRQQQNKLHIQQLIYLRLSQRLSRPWVSSYFCRFPMHIYCLPVQAVNHRRRRRTHDHSRR